MGDEVISILRDPEIWLGVLSVGLIFILATNLFNLRNRVKAKRTSENDGKVPVQVDSEDKEGEAPVIKFSSDSIKYIINVLSIRELKHRLNARLFITGALVSMSLGALLFMQASLKIEQSDVINGLIDRMDFVTSRLEDVNIAEGTGAKAIQDSLGKYAMQYLTRQLCTSCYPDSIRIDSIVSKQNHLAQVLAEVLVPIDRVAYDLSRLNGSSFQNRVLDLITLTLIRIGIILILVFTVQILLRVYRYHVRSADHCRAVMDSLILAESSNMSINDVFEIVNGKIDVEKEPNVPLEKIVDMIIKLKS